MSDSDHRLQTVKNVNTLLLQQRKLITHYPCGKILFNNKFRLAFPPQCPLVHHARLGGHLCTAIDIAFHEFDDLIIGRSLVSFGDFASCTVMNDNQTFLSCLIDVDRFHQPLAHGSAVAGMDVDVLGKKTAGAMAPASALFKGLHCKPAVLARERFLAGEEDQGIYGENRNNITSPSCTTYVFPSLRIFPAFLAPASPLY